MCGFGTESLNAVEMIFELEEKFDKMWGGYWSGSITWSMDA